jgi:hypothetical protein
MIFSGAVKKFTLFFFILVFFLGIIFLVTPVREAETITWGVNFSQMQTEALGLDWRDAYLAILQDLKVKNIKLMTQWDWIEGKKDNFYFQDIDWQIDQAEKYGVNIIYVVGMKTGRWPECHIPVWANGMSKKQQQEEILSYIEKVVLRYKGSQAIKYWQAENEPLFYFGQCPWYDAEFLKQEISLIKSLDSSRLVIVSDTGEWSSWIEAARNGDIVGTTMYRRLWAPVVGRFGFYTNIFIPAKSYGIKSRFIELVFGKPVINVELQAEPWGKSSIYDSSLQEQEKTMNLRQFKKNIGYARKSGLSTFYFWGTEWWYWLKIKHNKPEIWDEAKTLF